MTKEEKLSTLIDIVNKLPLKKDESLEITDILAGGVVSIVGNGILHTPEGDLHVAVKYTKDDIEINEKFSPLESRNILKYASSSHDVDAKILKKLQNNKSIKVPSLVEYFPEHRVTIMKNFNSDGYILFQDLLVEGKEIPDKVFKEVGKVLAEIRLQFSDLFPDLEGVEERILQIEERTDELRTSLYDNRMNYYNVIWRNLLNPEKSSFTWTDGHPKNIAVNDEGDIVVFDFGRSIRCDEEYPLANFLGQIILFILTGAIDYNKGVKYVQDTIDSYVSVMREEIDNYRLNEKDLVWYITGEFAHRGKTMRWIDPKIIKVQGDDFSQKVQRSKSAVFHLIEVVFDKDKPIVTMDKLYKVLHQINDSLMNNDRDYTLPEIRI